MEDRAKVEERARPTGGLPEYENPPVVEVVCGVSFKPLESLLIPHFGLLWNRFKDDYPRCQEAQPLLPVTEKGVIASENITRGLPLPRVWFVRNDETGIIQIQRDRFLHNWRKTKPEDAYPRYTSVIRKFEEGLLQFSTFLSELKLGTLTPSQYELTYVNYMPQGDGWESLAVISRVFPDFAWSARTERFLPLPEGINWQTDFALPGRGSRLQVKIRSATRQDGLRILLFELSARGISSEASHEGMRAWFDVAHEWIVRGFTDLTGKEIQDQVWRRIR